MSKSQNYGNPILNVNGRTIGRLHTAFQLSYWDTAVGWSENDKKLLFYWVNPNSNTIKYPDFQLFPVPLDQQAMADMAWAWLQKFSLEDHANLYNDGDVWDERGWRVWSEDWGHVNGRYQAFIAVEPYAIWIGK